MKSAKATFFTAMVFTLAASGFADAPASRSAGQLLAQASGVPPECERLTDPVQRAKCVEEKAKGTKK